MFSYFVIYAQEINFLTIVTIIVSISIQNSLLLLSSIFMTSHLPPFYVFLFAVGSVAKVFQFPIADNSYHDSYGLFRFCGIRSDPCS